MVNDWFAESTESNILFSTWMVIKIYSPLWLQIVRYGSGSESRDLGIMARDSNFRHAALSQGINKKGHRTLNINKSKVP